MEQLPETLLADILPFLQLNEPVLSALSICNLSLRKVIFQPFLAKFETNDVWHYPSAIRKSNILSFRKDTVGNFADFREVHF